MRLLERLALSLRADAHGVLDRLEERSLLMKQHLREAELALERKQARGHALEQTQRQLADDLAQAEAAFAELDADVSLALEGEEEELARYSLRKMLAARTRVRDLRTRGREVEEERERLARQVGRQEGELQDLRQRVRRAMAARDVHCASAAYSEIAIADEEIELELLRRRRPGQEAR